MIFNRPDGIGGRMRPISEFFADTGEQLGTDAIGQELEDRTRLGSSRDYSDYEFQDDISVTAGSGVFDNFLDSGEQLHGAGETVIESLPSPLQAGAIITVVSLLAVVVALGQLFDIQIG